jgi:hypothetical protein
MLVDDLDELLQGGQAAEVFGVFDLFNLLEFRIFITLPSVKWKLTGSCSTTVIPALTHARKKVKSRRESRVDMVVD